MAREPKAGMSVRIKDEVQRKYGFAPFGTLASPMHCTGGCPNFHVNVVQATTCKHCGAGIKTILERFPLKRYEFEVL